MDDKNIKSYQQALEALDTPTVLSIKQALEILTTRDNLEQIIKADVQIHDDISSKLIELDSKLKQKAYKITKVVDLAKYRASFSISEQIWWWNLETTGEPHPLNHLDWLWKGARSFLWSLNLGLLGTLAIRFLSGGSGLIEIVAIAIPSALALLQANGELTSSGKQGFHKLLDKLKLPSYLHEEAKLVSTGFLSLLLLIIWLLQPQIAQKFNQKAFKEHNQGNLAIAEQNYLKAITFDAENLDANYNLGNLYEDLQDFDNAKKYYLIAAKNGLPNAYNNLARLYIQQQKYAEAINSLKEGLILVNKEEQKPDKKPDDLPEVKYSILKNLGWARLMQNQYEEAEIYLKLAIDISSNPEYQKYIPNPGTTYCLFAQLLEIQKHNQKALSYWQNCRDLIKNRLASGEIINPEEDNWLFQAKAKLK